MENLIENKTNKNKKDGEDDEEKKKRPVIKSATDLQRLKLEKLMKNPEKPIIIPEPPKEKDYMQTVPSFVRNVMGSSAGAGSGEFHVYRHLRRKEYARQKCIQAKSMREQLDDEYQSKLEKNRLEAESKTAKKRAKRLKKKQRAKKPKIKSTHQDDEEKKETSDEENDDEEDEEDYPAIVEQQPEEKIEDSVVKVDNPQTDDISKNASENVVSASNREEESNKADEKNQEANVNHEEDRASEKSPIKDDSEGKPSDDTGESVKDQTQSPIELK